MKSALPFASLALLLTACSTIKKYEPKAEAGSAHPDEYPIYLYQLYEEVPRTNEVIGTMSINDTPFTVFGGSLEKELAALRRKARKVGADAVHLKSVTPPGFLHAKYRMEADLIRFQDEWETVPYTEFEFQDYLDQNRAELDPLEGIWAATDSLHTRVGIIRANPGEERDLVAFLLESTNPTWNPGDVKGELARGRRPGVYRGHYFKEDYKPQSIAFRLAEPRAKAFHITLSEDDPPVVFVRQY